MRRILIFSLVYYPRPIGGAEVAVKEITDRIAPSDAEFDMIALNPGGEKAEEQTERVPIRRDGVRAQVALGAQRAKELLNENGEGGRHGSELGFVPALPVVLK